MAYLMTTDPFSGAIVILTFQNPEPDSGDNFGAAVAFYENHILIGAPGDDGIAQDAGMAYLFDATTGELTRKFAIAGSFEGDRFGHAVAIDDGRYLIGAPYAVSPITAATRASAAYVFDDVNSEPVVTLFDPQPTAGDLSGPERSANISLPTCQAIRLNCRLRSPMTSAIRSLAPMP